LSRSSPQTHTAISSLNPCLCNSHYHLMVMKTPHVDVRIVVMALTICLCSSLTAGELLLQHACPFVYPVVLALVDVPPHHHTLSTPSPLRMHTITLHLNVYCDDVIAVGQSQDCYDRSVVVTDDTLESFFINDQYCSRVANLTIVRLLLCSRVAC
jgi:hypothetical protein